MKTTDEQYITEYREVALEDNVVNATGDDAFWLTTTQSKEVKFDTDSGDEGTVFVYVEMEPKKPAEFKAAGSYAAYTGGWKYSVSEGGISDMILEDEPEEQDGIDYLTYVTVVEKDEEYAELVYIIYKPVVDPIISYTVTVDVENADVTIDGEPYTCLLYTSRKHRPKYRRGQHGSHRQGRRHPKGVQQLSQEPVCISRHAVAHGVIDTSPRNQGEKCYQQIAGHRAAAQPGHDLRKDAYGHRSQERGHDAAARQQIHQPAQSSPEAADQLSYAVDVEDQCKAYAGQKGPEAGQDIVQKNSLHPDPPPTVLKHLADGQPHHRAQGNGRSHQDGVRCPACLLYTSRCV